MSRKDEILEELEEILTKITNYLGGIRNDILEGNYGAEMAYADLDFLDSSDVDYYSRIKELSEMLPDGVPDNVYELRALNKRPVPNSD